MRFSTKAIHAWADPEPGSGAVIPPIYMTSTFVQESPGHHKGYDYTRGGNPNFTILEKTLAELEGAQFATIFSSGLGALTAMIFLLSPGDRVVSVGSLYGGSWRLFTKVFARYGIIFENVRPEQLNEALKKPAKWLFFETPSNPLLEIIDIEACVMVANSHDLLTVLDNTFATPFFQSPISFGIDLVWHSTTKYIGGHSDVIGGAVLCNDKEIKRQLDFHRMAVGLNPSPFDAWLTTRGLKTLGVRMERHAKNAEAIVHFLEKHPLVKHIHYPGLKNHPGHQVAKKQMRGFGGMIAVEFDLTLEESKKLIASLRYFTLAESLGGIESLISHPPSMTHASIAFEERKRMGIADGLVRISVGIEDHEDLIEDLEQGLKEAGRL